MELERMKKNFQVGIIIAILVGAIFIAISIYLKPEGRYVFHIIPGNPVFMSILDTRTGTLVDLRDATITWEKVNGKMRPQKANYE